MWLTTRFNDCRSGLASVRRAPCATRASKRVGCTLRPPIEANEFISTASFVRCWAANGSKANPARATLPISRGDNVGAAGGAVAPLAASRLGLERATPATEDFCSRSAVKIPVEFFDEEKKIAVDPPSNNSRRMTTRGGERRLFTKRGREEPLPWKRAEF